MAFAAGVQKLIYTRGPCYEYPLACGYTAGDNGSTAQTPVYFLLAFAEIPGFTTLSEYSYSEAPKNMRTLVQALRELASGVGSALGMAVLPLSDDPKVTYPLASVMGVCAAVFWMAFDYLKNEGGRSFCGHMRLMPQANIERRPIFNL